MNIKHQCVVTQKMEKKHDESVKDEGDKEKKMS